MPARAGGVAPFLCGLTVFAGMVFGVDDREKLRRNSRMKAILAVFAALSLAACNKPAVVVAPPPSTPLPIATPAPTPPPTPVAVRITTPSPTPVAVAKPPPATPARHLAAEGVFYLVSRVRIETNDGIVGLPPGTGV
jgi:hypothetical protein